MELCGDCEGCDACGRWENGEEVKLADEDYAGEVEHAAVFAACAPVVFSAAGEEQSGEGERG